MDKFAGRNWILAPIGVLLLVSACVAPGQSPSASVQPSSSAGRITGLPPGCEPLELLTPTGERIDLSGPWNQETSAGEPATTWWLGQLGDCVFGVGIVEGFPDAGLYANNLEELRGRVGTDFALVGDITQFATYLPNVGANRAPTYAPIRLLIEFDEAGGIRIREDRVYGVQGIRCPDPAFHCSQPIVLTRAD